MRFQPSRHHAAAATALLLLLASLNVSAAPARSYVTQIPELLQHAPASDWQAIADDDIVVLQLPSGPVVTALAPFSAPLHTARWRSLIRSGYFSHSSIQRAQENYVVQWGENNGSRPAGDSAAALPNQTHFALTPALAERVVALNAADSYTANVGFIDGFAVGIDKARQHAWLLHCHGAVGSVQADPDSSEGGVYFYAAIGNPTRELDDKLPVVGRVIEGIERLSTLQRGPGEYGFLDEAHHVPILQTQLASEMPAQTRPRFERLRTDSGTFAELLRLRAASLRKQGDADAAYPLDACSVPLPVRRVAMLPPGE
ncbi:MAG: peptidylprolyl isomerase [Stenotrophomonas sp.]